MGECLAKVEGVGSGAGGYQPCDGPVAVDVGSSCTCGNANWCVAGRCRRGAGRRVEADSTRWASTFRVGARRAGELEGGEGWKVMSGSVAGGHFKPMSPTFQGRVVPMSIALA